MDGLEIFLATVSKVYITSDQFLPFPMEESKIDDLVVVHNNNKNFSDKDVRFLGAIEFQRENPLNVENYAFPFDKNNLTYPIEGETVFIIKNAEEYYWLPYTVTQYPNFREDYKTTGRSIKTNESNSNNQQQNYNEVNSTGITNNNPGTPETQKKKYKVKEKIKFLKPKPGDTIIQGRVGNTIRFSESFLVPTGNAEEPSPSIIIRNKQSSDANDKKLSELVEEDINKDGSSIYIVSKDVKIPYNHSTIKKQKVAFKNYPKDTDIKGDRIFLNSDQVLLASKAREFIIFGKGNTGVITDGRFSVDAAKEIYLHNEKDITIHSKGTNKIFLNSDDGGKIYLGKDKGPQRAGSDVQNMVLGNDLVQILDQLLTILSVHGHPCSCGGESKSSQAGEFTSLKGRLNRILSKNNFLSK